MNTATRGPSPRAGTERARYRSRPRPDLLRQLLGLCLAAAVAACGAPPPAAPPPDVSIPEYVPRHYVSMVCINHTGSYIHGFQVEEPEFGVPESYSKHSKYGPGCGGTIAAGYALPNQWRPGMKVKVRWKPNGKEWTETTTNVMRYDEVGTLYVHIFKGGQARVVAANLGPRHPNHPIARDAEVPPPEEP